MKVQELTDRFCEHCRSRMTVKRIQTDVTGAVPVNIAICQICDVRQCQHCRAYIQNRAAKTCTSCGRSLDTNRRNGL